MVERAVILRWYDGFFGFGAQWVRKYYFLVWPLHSPNIDRHWHGKIVTSKYFLVIFGGTFKLLKISTRLQG